MMRQRSRIQIGLTSFLLIFMLCVLVTHHPKSSHDVAVKKTNLKTSTVKPRGPPTPGPSRTMPKLDNNPASSEDYISSEESDQSWFAWLKDSMTDTECPVTLIRLHEVRAPEEDVECMTLAVKPKVDVCPYPVDRDIYVSGSIKDTGIWEEHIVHQFQEVLTQHPGIEVFDLGAHIGMYTLIAAAMGHSVIAVEPNGESIKRLDQALVSNGLTSKVVVIQNALSDHCGRVTLIKSDHNQGDIRVEDSSKGSLQSITLDTLVQLDPDPKTVLLKIDIQGYEHRIMQRARHFFDTYDVAYIFMEWVLLREYYVLEDHKSRDKDLVERAILFLTQRHYVPFSAISHRKLDPDFWFGWSEDVLWVLNKYI